MEVGSFAHAIRTEALTTKDRTQFLKIPVNPFNPPRKADLREKLL
jgi:hypothetical protein